MFKIKIKKTLVSITLLSLLSLNAHANIVMDNDLFQNAAVTSADAWETAGCLMVIKPNFTQLLARLVWDFLTR